MLQHASMALFLTSCGLARPAHVSCHVSASVTTTSPCPRPTPTCVLFLLSSFYNPWESRTDAIVDLVYFTLAHLRRGSAGTGGSITIPKGTPEARCAPGGAQGAAKALTWEQSARKGLCRICAGRVSVAAR